MNNKPGVYFEINIRLTLNKCFLRAYYMISTMRDTGDAIINKTKGYPAFVELAYISAVKADGDLYLKNKTQTTGRGK